VRTVELPWLWDGSDNSDRVRSGSREPQPIEWGRFREVDMDQIYLTIAVSSLTVLVGAYVLGVALV
jgi:hypothetical protein